MKFFKALLALSTLLLSLSLPVTAFANVQSSNFNLVHNGTIVEFTEDTKPINVNGRTLLQLKSVFDLINTDNTGSFEWIEETNTISIKKDDTSITLWINKTAAEVNGELIEIETAPFIYNERTYVPLRFVSDTFGLFMNWNSNTSTASLADKEYIHKIISLLISAPTLDSSRVSMDMNMSASLSEYKIDDVSTTMNIIGNADLAANIKFDLINQFLYSKQKLNVDLNLLGNVDLAKFTSENNIKYESEIYDDGKNLYYGWENAYKKSGSTLSNIFDSFDFISFDALSNFSISSLEELNDMIGSNDFDYGCLASLSLTIDADGNNVIEGNIIFPEEVIYPNKYMYSYYEDEQFEPSPSYPIFCKFVYDKATPNLKSITISADLPLNIFGYLPSAYISFNLEILNINFNPSFENIIPAEIKEKAVESPIYDDNWEDEFPYYDDWEYDYYDNSEPTILLEDLNLEIFGLENYDFDSSSVDAILPEDN